MRFLGATMALLVVLVSLAGCFSGDAPRDGEDEAPFVFVDPMRSVAGAGHDHADWAQHRFAQNLTLRAHLMLTEQEGATARAHSIDKCGQWLAIGRHFPDSYGLDIVDVADPAQPVWRGKYRDAESVPADRDVAWTDDCNYLIQANEGDTPDTAGLRVINARDKANPTFESFWRWPGLETPLNTSGVRVPSGFHTVYALRVGGEQFVYGLNFGVHIFKLAMGANAKMSLTLQGRYVASEAEQIRAANEAAGTPNATYTRRAIYGHDMAAYLEGARVVLYLANAYDGLRIVDVSNPATPRELGHWVPPGPGDPWYVHSVRTYRHDDGRRITIVGDETFAPHNNQGPSPLWILDTSDPADIHVLATWSNPGGHAAGGLLQSLHFLEVEGDLLWVTHYHGGLWVLDVSDPAAPWVRGHYMPAEDTGYVPPPGCCLGWNLRGIPMTMDLKVEGDLGYLVDFSTGLYLVELDAA